MFDLADKVAAVVGAGSGIGRAIAIALAADGAVVSCLDIDESGAAKTAKLIADSGGSGDFASLDIRDTAQVSAALHDVAKDGRLDIAVSTPGINIRKPMLRYSDSDYEQVMAVNLRGTFAVMRAAGQIMVPRGSGSIIVISSVSARVVEPGQVIYAGIKAALAQMVRVFAAEVGPYGVRVNAIAPGPTETELTLPIRQDPAWRSAYQDKVALARWAQPEEIAGPAVFLASAAASYVTGEILFVDGGWTDLDRRFQGGPVMESQE
jgi:NAD(P)-dependent dehydrogenase (short-subunit alcohol dehydrogenase family)